jgi:hypothetical protein
MISRWSLGLVVSLLAHVGVVAIGLLMGARGFSGPVDVEIAGVNIEEIKDLPLGGPQSGEGRSGASARYAQPGAAGAACRRDAGRTAGQGSEDQRQHARP